MDLFLKLCTQSPVLAFFLIAVAWAAMYYVLDCIKVVMRGHPPKSHCPNCTCGAEDDAGNDEKKA